jgi:hypothetical protein
MKLNFTRVHTDYNFWNLVWPCFVTQSQRVSESGEMLIFFYAWAAVKNSQQIISLNDQEIVCVWKVTPK